MSSRAQPGGGEATDSRHTEEWQFLLLLRQSKDRFESHLPQLDFPRKGLRLWSKITYLNNNLLLLLATPWLDSILHTELELSELRSESDSDSETYSGDEDILPAPHCHSLLTRLCCFLEDRVNPGSTMQPAKVDATTKYPKLRQLVEWIASPHSPRRFGLIPMPNSGREFLFLVSSDKKTVSAFADLCEPMRDWPRKTVRKQMHGALKAMKLEFDAVLKHVDTFQMSPGSLELMSRPSQVTPLSISVLGIHQYQHQVLSANAFMSSHFGRCQNSSEKHRACLQLPTWEELSSNQTSRVYQEMHVRLLCSICPREAEAWQSASMKFVQPWGSISASNTTFCTALLNAFEDGRDLEFYVSDKAQHPNNRVMHLPNDLDSLMKQEQTTPPSIYTRRVSLHNLIEEGHFDQELSLGLWLRTKNKKAIATEEQRQALCVKLVLGLMLSLGSRQSLNSWNPRFIQFLTGDDELDYSPCVALLGGDDRLDPHELPTLETEESPTALPAFTLMAILLLQIRLGGDIKGIEVPQTSDAAAKRAWKELRNAIGTFLTSARPQLSTPDFLQAVTGCLEFHVHYFSRCKNETLPRRVIAWQLIHEKILSKIDKSFTISGGFSQALESIPDVAPPDPEWTNGTRLSEEPNYYFEAWPAVTFFDGNETGQGSSDASKADEFYQKLATYHQSFIEKLVPLPDDEESSGRIRIAILDTGIDLRCPLLLAALRGKRIRAEWCHDWVGGENGYKDETGSLHGTNCAYLLNKVAPKANIYVEKVFSGTNIRQHECANIAKAIEHAVEKWDVHIISMSFGLQQPRLHDGEDPYEAEARHRLLLQTIEKAMQSPAGRNSRIIFAAASNSGRNRKRAYPASSASVICVHASDGYGMDGGINPAPQSGDNFMTLGMGHNLMVRSEENRWPWRYARLSGTSYATPVAAGIAATILDITTRTPTLSHWTRDELLRPWQMNKVLREMSIPSSDQGNSYRYLAPWHLWEEGWQQRPRYTDIINDWFHERLRLDWVS